MASLATRSGGQFAPKCRLAASLIVARRTLRCTSVLAYHLKGEENHFAQRHIGPRKHDVVDMLNTVGCASLDELVQRTIPPSIMLAGDRKLDLPSPTHEQGMLDELRTIANKNEIYRSYIGMGYYGCITPSVVVRQMLENAGWITQYTPYQAEISQGRLESLMNFQTMVADLTGLHVANASLLDEATACAEAMTLCHRMSRGRKNVFLVDHLMHPQNVALIRTRAEPLGIEVRVGRCSEMVVDKSVCGVIVQYPNTYGTLRDYSPLVTQCNKNKALFVMCTDLLSLTLVKSPGEWGAHVAVGSAQRFGVPMGFGGPHAAFMSVWDGDGRHRLARSMPGRIVGVTNYKKDGDPLGAKGYRLALQTREQHIRREKATSNICTAQALLANMSAMYAVYHGPDGLRRIASKAHRCAVALGDLLDKYGPRVQVLNKGAFFDTLHLRVPNVIKVHARAIAQKVNLRYFDDGSIGVSLDELVCVPEVYTLVKIIAGHALTDNLTQDEVADAINGVSSPLLSKSSPLCRETRFLEHPIFNTHHSEQQMVRYMKKLENKDVSLTHSMIPLGSCTMKLNSSSQLIPITWPQFNALHPFAPHSQTEGYQILLQQLEKWLCEITGYDHISFQPNSGAQGEYAGLLAVRGYHRSIDEKHRNICLIPDSAHGTNPASAILAGYRIVVVKSDNTGAIDINDLKNKVLTFSSQSAITVGKSLELAKNWATVNEGRRGTLRKSSPSLLKCTYHWIERHNSHVAAIMVTYPSTFGVFDEAIQEVCHLVHHAGGQVYLDGANLNPQVALCRPGDYGSDVSHLNLHKTFCIPHGGGGPGMGPIGVKTHLAPFLPNHPIIKTPNRMGKPVSGAQWGSASILPICWAYIRMMGQTGLKYASQVSILTANYCMKRLEDSYRIEYRGRDGFVSHEFILDCRKFKRKAGITVNDIAKRMMDYGFHAPTMSWPIADCLMMEPTESEDKGELDRFCDAMIAIRDEIGAIERGEVDKMDNMLKNAPHTLEKVTMTDWPHQYTREQAVYPKPWCHEKHWPTVGRLDDAFGDKNLMCTCPPIEAYQ